MNHLFSNLANRCARFVGSPWAFLTACLLVVLWAVSGPTFGYSDTWELVINTATTIITFLMVFLIQNTQNRDAKALHLKLDELIYAIKHADNELINCETLTETELNALALRYESLRQALLTQKAAHQSKKERHQKKTPSEPKPL